MDLCKPNSTIVLSNYLEQLAEQLSERLFERAQEGLKRALIIVPHTLVKHFLEEWIEKRQGYLLGIRILGLPQAIEHITKIAYQKEARFLRQDLLTFHLEQELERRELFDQGDLKDYLQEDSTRRVHLAEALSRAFLHYSVYGGAALKSWETIDGWQQEIWKEVKLHWDIPQELFREPPEKPLIDMEIHLFALSSLAPIYRTLFSSLARYWPIHSYFHSPTPHFWGDILSDHSFALLDKRWQKEGIKKEERLALDSCRKETNRLFLNWATSGKELFLHLTEGDFEEFYTQPEGTTLLSEIQHHLFELSNFDTLEDDLPSDDSIQIHQAPSKMREIEIAHDHIAGLLASGLYQTSDILILAPDLNHYAPYIESIFGDEKSPFGYILSDLSGNKSTLKRFFALFDSRLAPDQLLELFPSKTLEKIVEEKGVRFGYDKAMRAHILQTEGASAIGSWRYAFDQILEELPLLHSTFDLSEAEELGKAISLIERIHADITFVKGASRTLPEWVSLLETLVTSYFPLEEERLIFIQGIRRLAQVKAFVTTTFPFSSIKRLIDKILDTKEQSRSSRDKPAIRFASLQEGCLFPIKILALIGLDEDSFPRRESARSINQLKRDPLADPAPSALQKDRYLFLQSLLFAKDKILFSYVGDETHASLLLQELQHATGKNLLQTHPPLPLCQPRAPSLSIATSSPPSCLSLTIDLWTLNKLARNPVQLFCNETLKLRLNQYEDKASSEFLLSPLDRAIFTRATLKESRDSPKKASNTPHRLPTALLGKIAEEELEQEISALQSQIKAFSIGQIFTATFNPNCKELTRLSPDHWVLPSPTFSLEDGSTISIRGTLEQLTDRGILLFGEESVSEQWKYLPHLLLAPLLHELLPPQLLFAKSATTTPIHASQEQITAYLHYYQAALRAPSPLLPKTIEPFNKREYAKVEKLFESPDPYLSFLPPPLDPTSNESWHHHLTAIASTFLS